MADQIVFEKQMIDKDKATFADRLACVTDDEGNDLFIATPTKKLPSRVAAIGAMVAGAEKVEMIADAAMNDGKDGVVMLPQYNVVFVLDELAAMEADLNDLREGRLAPVQSLTAEEWTAVNREPIGMACQWDGTRVSDHVGL